MDDDPTADDREIEPTTALDATDLDATAAIDPTVISGSYKVLGHNADATGVASGVEGVTDSVTDDAAGVTGKASTATGQTYGVFGASASQAVHAAGVRGQSAASGAVYGVHGVTESARGVGLRGDATAAGPYATIGVFGTTSGSGYAATGVVPTYTPVFAHGVLGRADATGTVVGTAGVRGRNSADSGAAYGVWGSTNADDTAAAGVRGSSTHDAAPALEGAGRLHVRANIADNALYGQNFPAFIENTDTSSGHWVLGLKSGYSGDPTVGHNYVQFIDGDDDAVGMIQGNGNGGVEYRSTGADYAEALPRLDPDEEIRAGDVVGVVDGAVTRETADAARVLAITDAPAVTGNAPMGDSEAARTEVVAFTGQIPVRVRGPVSDGDLVVPSGDADGTGVAVAPAERAPGMPILGQAWETTDGPGVDRVTVAIGLDDPAVVDTNRRLSDLERENEALRATLQRKDDRIDALEERLERVEAAVGTDASAAARAADAPADD